MSLPEDQSNDPTIHVVCNDCGRTVWIDPKTLPEGMQGILIGALRFTCSECGGAGEGRNVPMAQVGVTHSGTGHPQRSKGLAERPDF